MKAKMPTITLAGDKDRIMARNGGLIGWDHHRVVWGFGFLPGSESAKAHGVAVPQRTFVLAQYDGTAIDTWTGDRNALPDRFQRVVLYHHPL